MVFQTQHRGESTLWSWNGVAATSLGIFQRISDPKTFGQQFFFLSAGELYATDGTQVNLIAGSVSAPVTDYTQVAGTTYYLSNNQLYAIRNGVSIQITNLPNYYLSSRLTPGPHGSVLFVSGNGDVILQSDGVAEDPLQTVGSGQYISQLFNVHRTLYYTVFNDLPHTASAALYRWDGTSTKLVMSFNNLNAAFSPIIDSLTDFKGQLYFMSNAPNAHEGLQVWKVDAAGTAIQLTHIPGGVLDSQQNYTVGLIPSGRSLYFESNNNDLYRITTGDNVQLVTTGVDPASGLAFSLGPFHSLASSDFNGNGFSDVLWRNTNSGDATIWNTTPTSYAPRDLGVVGGDWQIAGVGDFNGSGYDGILWRNADGELTTWNALSSGHPEAFEGTGATYSVSNDWQVAGVGDFNGDGLSDILWRASNGDMDIWRAKPGSSPTAFKGEPVKHVSNDWQIEGVGDFNGAGKDGILWRNANTGDVKIWNANSYTHGFTSEEFAVPGSGWTIAGVGDFTASGQDDILWRNANGQLSVWAPTADAASFNSADLGSVSTDWQVQGVGDYNGDGFADILWRNANTGDVTIWESNGTAANGIASSSFTPKDLGVVSADWQIYQRQPLCGARSHGKCG